MTTEELALQAKSGDKQAIELLWLNVQGYIYSMAKHYYDEHRALCSAYGTEKDDLRQVGYFAILKTLKYFNEDCEYKFTTYLFRVLLREFNNLSHRASENYKNYSTNRTMLNVNGASSLDASVNVDDSTDTTKLARLVDPSGEEAFRRIEEDDYVSSLHDNLEMAINSLPDRQADYIRRHYYDDEPISHIAKQHSITPSSVRSRIDRALSTLKGSEFLAEYKREQYSRAYKGGYKSWYNSRCSIQESIVIKIDEKEREIHKANFSESNQIDSYLSQFM